MRQKPQPRTELKTTQNISFCASTIPPEKGERAGSRGTVVDYNQLSSIYRITGTNRVGLKSALGLQAKVSIIRED